MRDYVKGPTGLIIGWVDVEPNGDKNVYLQGEAYIGYYKASDNNTYMMSNGFRLIKDCQGTHLYSQGDNAKGLLMEGYVARNNKWKAEGRFNPFI